MTDENVQKLVTATYLTLADCLDALPEERWDAPSLCEGWRVKEVVAHLTMPARYGEDEFMAELRGPQIFTAFVRDGLRGGYDGALRKHYSMDMNELTQRWHQQLSQGNHVSARP